MIRAKLKLVSSQPLEAIYALRFSEAQEAWLSLCGAPHLPQAWLAWTFALERLEAERLRFFHEPKKR